MSEPGLPLKQRPQLVPMDDAEYRLVRRSHLARVVFSFVCGCAATFASRIDHLPVGMLPLFLLGAGMAYGLGGKFFPDSDAFSSSRATNYRRARKGLPPLTEDQTRECAHFDEFRRG